MSLTKAFNLAELKCKEKEYPYIFIDQSPEGKSQDTKFTQIYLIIIESATQTQ